MAKRAPYTLNETPTSAPPIWRSVEEKETPEKFKALATAEFPEGFVGADQLLSRRNFMSLTGGATAAFGLSGCVLRRPKEKILPYSKAPEQLIPGVAAHYATVIDRGGEPLGLLVESHEARPTKVEGNPSHPQSLGSTDIMAQATVLDLYDPDRLRHVVVRAGGKTTTQSVDAWTSSIGETMQGLGDGEGAHLLVRPSVSLSVQRLRKAVKMKLPKATFHQYAPVAVNAAEEGAKIAFGRLLKACYQLRYARVIASFDADILGHEPGSVRHAREFAEGRKLRTAHDGMNRLYVVESALSITGSNADHRLRIASQDVEDVLLGLAQALGEQGIAISLPKPRRTLAAAWVRALAKDLVAHKGGSAVIAGMGQPARVHAAAHAINLALSNVGSVIALTPSIEDGAVDSTGIEALTQALEQGSVKTLFVLGGNPAFDAPSDLGFEAAAKKAGKVVYLGTHDNETGKLSHTSVPLAHPFETWGDAQTSDGTVSIQQPLIEPLFGGLSEVEVLGLIAGEQNWRGYGAVRETLRAYGTSGLFDMTWKRALKRGTLHEESKGVVPLKAAELTVANDAIAKAFAGAGNARALSTSNLEVAFYPDAKLYDGSSANNPWLLELPDPMTRITWDNVARMSSSTAKALGVASGDLIELSAEGAKAIEVAAWIAPGQADNSIALTLGWGRKECGRYGKGHGFNVYPLRTSKAMWFRDGVRIRKIGRKYAISQTQEHHSMEGRAIAIDATLEEYRHSPEFAQYRSVTPKTPPLWKEVEYKGHKWGMTVDLNTCIGCNACAAACQAENNVPVVGKEQVAKGREMHWLRIDRYFVGESENDPQVAFQPVACVHCEEAPCENVCPVNATVHSPEGTNDMAYNRCIGTRYCSNNCPYKVRRFNYLNFHGESYGDVPEIRKMQFNPNVTVRMRGVMEKCTYCIQRIEEAKIGAKREERPMRDGDITTACQQACPTQSIIFGDLNDAGSRVTQLAQLDRGYKLLGEIGTQPRTTYLAKIRNPNPDLVGHGQEEKKA